MTIIHSLDIDNQVYEISAEVDNDMLVEIKSVVLVQWNGTMRTDITELLANYGNTIESLENSIDWQELYAEQVAEMVEHQYEEFEERQFEKMNTYYGD